MRTRSPPWGAIEAFIVASRAASFKEAAEHLSLSPSAFSRRVKALENHVGIRLFDRCAAGPTLTRAGTIYLQRLEPGFQSMRLATESMAPAAHPQSLRVGVSPAFAISWLVPRLSRFYESRSPLTLSLQARASVADLEGGVADVGILYGTGEWPGLETQRMFGVEAFMVAAPALLERLAAPPSLDALLSMRMLEVKYPAQVWEAWIARACAGVPDPTRTRVSFSSTQVMYEAAASGLGIALGVCPLVDPFLADGRLVRAHALACALPGSYFVAALPAMRRSPAVDRLWRWLSAESTRPGGSIDVPIGCRETIR